MDCAKIGRLILQLRKEKNLTQREVAEQLHVSNKTVSKWECGLGCPDVSLWEGLAALLGADLLTLLQGELSPNLPDTGKLERLRFYCCPVCGNILTSTGSASVACCGRQLSALLPPAAAPPGHSVSVGEVEDEYYIQPEHEMRREHYLLFAAFVCGDCLWLRRMYPEQSPAFRMPRLRPQGLLYLYCTQHGLMKYRFSAARPRLLPTE